MSFPIPTAHQSFHPFVNDYPKMSVPEKIFAEGIYPTIPIHPQSNCSQSINEESGSYIYTVGTIYPIFPSFSVEKEFYQSMDENDLNNEITRDQLFKVFSKKNESGSLQNLYIAKQMVWVFKAGGLDLYILAPDTYETLEAFIDSLAPSTAGLFFQAVIGIQLSITGELPDNDTFLPIVLCKQTFIIDSNGMTKNIQDAVKNIKLKPPSIKEVNTLLLNPMMKLVQNPGHTDSKRAINFSLIRCPDTYSAFWQMFKGGLRSAPKDLAGFSFHGVQATPSSIQGSGMSYDIIFTFWGNSTNRPVKLYCKVDVKGQFPFLLSSMERYFGMD